MDSLEGEGNQGRWVAGTFVSLCCGHPLLGEQALLGTQRGWDWDYGGTWGRGHLGPCLGGEGSEPGV